MSRNLIFSEDEYYHIFNRGVEKRKIFLDKGDYNRFVKLLYSANSDSEVHLSNYQGLALIEIPRGNPLVAIGAWVLMPNHFHILIKEINEKGISKFMHKLLTGYTMYFNTKCKRKGSLFEGTFGAKHLNTDQYLKYQYSYIHLNPIGIIDSGWKEKNIKNKKMARKFINDYKYSSFQDYIGKKREEKMIIEPKQFPEYFESLTDMEQMINDWVDFIKA